MPSSSYVESIRARIGHDLLLLPAVSAVFRNGDRFLLARQRGGGEWGLVGGGVEPGESPQEAVIREVLEEIGVRPEVFGIIGAYGGPDLIVRYPNGDHVSYVTIAFLCALPADAEIVFADGELVEIGWFTREEISVLRRHAEVDRVLADAP